MLDPPTALLDPTAVLETPTAARSCELIFAEYYAAAEALDAARRYALPHGCVTRIYSKSGSCSEIDAATVGSDRVSCSELQNVGREQHTFAHHVSTHWDSLAERVHFVALPLSGGPHENPQQIDDDRLRVFRAILEEDAASARSGRALQGFRCVCLKRPAKLDGYSKWQTGLANRDWPGPLAACPQERVSELAAFHIDSYQRYELARASPRPLGAWAARHLGLDNSSLASIPACYEGLASTTRRLIQARPRELYRRLEQELAVAAQSEATMYMERLMAAAYGGHVWAK